MLTITLTSKAFAKKNEIVAFIEDEIRDLYTTYDYDIIEDDFVSVNYPQDVFFESKVMAVLVRAINKIEGHSYE